MELAEVTSQMSLVDGSYVAQVAVDYVLSSLQDITGYDGANMPPSPINLSNFLVIVATAVIDAVEADANYDVYWRTDAPA